MPIDIVVNRSDNRLLTETRVHGDHRAIGRLGNLGMKVNDVGFEAFDRARHPLGCEQHPAELERQTSANVQVAPHGFQLTAHRPPERTGLDAKGRVKREIEALTKAVDQVERDALGTTEREVRNHLQHPRTSRRARLCLLKRSHAHPSYHSSRTAGIENRHGETPARKRMLARSSQAPLDRACRSHEEGERRGARGELPGVSAVAGTAEELPLGPGSADAACAGQAFHWFDVDRALDEIARVLRPGAIAIAAWNTPTEDGTWYDAVIEFLKAANPDHLPATSITWSEAFAAHPRYSELLEIAARHEQPTDRATFRRLLGTHSAINVRPSVRRGRLIDEALAVAEAHGASMRPAAARFRGAASSCHAAKPSG